MSDTVDDFSGCAFVLLWIFGVLLGLAMGFGKGCQTGAEWERNAAKEAGVGRYVIDEETDLKTFVYGVKP